jgi:hypothetical protein
MSQRIIEVVVSPTGETTIKTRCYTGGDCLQATKFLEQSLGITISDLKTSEFYQTAVQPQQVQQ